MSTIHPVTRWGYLTIRKRERFQSGCRDGLRPGWTEYQVWEGRKILSRHEHLLAAERDAQSRIDGFWDEQARQLRERNDRS